MDKGSNFSPTAVGIERVDCSQHEVELIKAETEESRRSRAAEDLHEQSLQRDGDSDVFEPWRGCCQSLEIPPLYPEMVPSLTATVDGAEGDGKTLGEVDLRFQPASGVDSFPAADAHVPSRAPALVVAEAASPVILSGFPTIHVPEGSDEKKLELGTADRNFPDIWGPKCKLRPALASTVIGKSDDDYCCFSDVDYSLKRSEAKPGPCGREKEVAQKRNSLTVPCSSSSWSSGMRRSSSLTNLRSSANLSCCFSSSSCSRDQALTAPSSPDSFYCDSMFSSSSYGTASVDLNCPPMTRSLSCSALCVAWPRITSTAPTAATRPRRSNSSDSAIVLPGEEWRTSAFLLSCLRMKLQQPPLSTCDPGLARASVLWRRPPQASFSLDGDQLPAHNAPSVVVSDHSDGDGPVAAAAASPPAEDLPSLPEDYSIGSGGGDSLGCQAFRKLSDCSTCSFGSSFSMEDFDDPCDQSQLQRCEDDRPQQPSGWRKVRNIVHWSPFVQTYKKQKYPWVQLAGHQGSFKAGGQGTILKKLCPKEEKCLLKLMQDDLAPFVPEYKGSVEGEDCEKYLQLQDLLKDFDSPCVMDCKIGVRTYLEEELAKAKEKSKLRKDMYEKMVQVDPSAPTEEENRLKGVTKPRYMVWRETISSTATLGFRIEGIKRGSGISSKDFKMIQSVEQVTKIMRSFLADYEYVVPQYVKRLEDLRNSISNSKFFSSHELIGSSLLFVHDNKKAGVWMIDFAKTRPLPEGVRIDHKSPWVVGNHEDGYLVGLDNLIRIFRSIAMTAS